MLIIPGPEIDLISPFPANQSHRIWGWMQCFKSFYETDDTPQTKAAFDAMIANYLSRFDAFGVIDRDNRLGLKHPVPLVGLVGFEHIGPSNVYAHFISTRVAHGTGIMDQALQTGIKYTFDNSDRIFRVSGLIPVSNKPAKNFLSRNGFQFEACLRGMNSCKGVPQDMLHLGLFRDQWQYDPRPLRIRGE